MQSWTYRTHHKEIKRWASRHSAPAATVNFDDLRRRRPGRSKSGARPFSANGGSATAVVDNPEEAGDALFAFTRSQPPQRRAQEPLTPSKACTRSSSEASRPRPCHRRPTPQSCYSGPCSPPARSPFERSIAGRRSPTQPTESTPTLTWAHELTTSTRRRPRHYAPLIEAMTKDN
jgi:hypothetical protein